MDIVPIKSQRDYRRVLKEIEGLMSARRDTPEGDRLDVLVTLVEAWERSLFPTRRCFSITAVILRCSPSWASLEGSATSAPEAILRDAAQARGSSG